MSCPMMLALPLRGAVMSMTTYGEAALAISIVNDVVGVLMYLK
jgi:hypothetical protein